MLGIKLPIMRAEEAKAEAPSALCREVGSWLTSEPAKRSPLSVEYGGYANGDCPLFRRRTMGKATNMLDTIAEAAR